jgi:hypothetical protein
MTRMLYRLGRGAAAHPWRTISAWVLIVLAIAGLAATVGGTPQDDYNVPGARAQVGIAPATPGRAAYPALPVATRSEDEDPWDDELETIAAH